MGLLPAVPGFLLTPLPVHERPAAGASTRSNVHFSTPAFGSRGETEKLTDRHLHENGYSDLAESRHPDDELRRRRSASARVGP